MKFNRLKSINFSKERKDFILIIITLIYAFFNLYFFKSLQTKKLKIKNKKPVDNIYNFMKKTNDDNKDTTDNTMHRWNENIDEYIKSNIEDINKEILNNIGDDFEYVPEMTELYWSSKGNNNSDKQYVSTHMDGPFFYCNLYRALITINGNKNISTVFTNDDIDTNLRKYDVILFDYDKAPHYIYMNDKSKDNSQRIILKLHYAKSKHCRKVHCDFGRQTRDLFERNKKGLYFDGYFARKFLHYYTYKEYILIIMLLLFIYNYFYKDSYSIYILYLFVIIEFLILFYTIHFNFINYDECNIN